jgi:uncharacterized protein (TIGR04222 family)
MHMLATQGDTWGIPGPAFAGLYLVATVVVVSGTALILVVIRSGRGRGSARELHPYEVAYLIGGRRRAVATAVAGLHVDGAIETFSRRLCATAAPETMRTPLDIAVHDAISSARANTARTLETADDVRRALDGIRDGLVRDGLAPGPRELSRSRLAALLPVALLCVGLARLVAGAANGRPVGVLVVIMFALGMAIVVMLANAQKALRSGTSAVKAARARYGHLAPSMSPAWQTYGAPGAALGVALFGMAALTSIDPQFAAASGLRSHFATSSASSGSPGGGGGGGGCGGGGGGGGGCGG